MVHKIPQIVGEPGALDSATEETVENNRPWSNLPDDVLSLIISRLFAGVRVAFRSVCKSWKSVYIIPTRYFQLPVSSSGCESPCLVSLDNKIFHPIYNECLGMDIEWESGLRVRVAKDDWLLISGCQNDLFFLNPFTKTKIILPDIVGSMRSMCFSSSPTSTDWQIVVGATTNEKDKIKICSIKCGEDSWSNYEYPKEFRFSECNAVFHKGSYYFLNENAGLLIYNPKKKTTRIYNASKCITKKIEASYVQQYLLESDKGKLMAVFVSGDGSWIQICQWDDDKKTLETIQSLGNKMLFVSRTLSLCEVATVQGLSNKIYFPRFVGDHSLFYSLSTKKYHTFVSGTTYNNFGDSSFQCSCTWMKP